MKRWSTLILVLVVLVAFGGPGAAQPPSAPKSSPPTIEKGPSTPGASRTIDKASPKLSGRVTAVDPAAGTYTVMIDGKPATVKVKKGAQLPPVGATVDLVAASGGGGAGTGRFVFASCEECNGVCPGVCFLGPNSCRCYLEHLRTKP